MPVQLICQHHTSTEISLEIKKKDIVRCNLVIFSQSLVQKLPTVLEKLNYHKELIEDCKAGKQNAQFKLYRMYSKAMYNTCCRMLGNEMDAEDVLQLAFVKVFKNIGQYQYKATPGAWIKRIVVNGCLDFLKKRKIHFEEINDRLEVAEVKETEVNYDVSMVKQAVSNLAPGYKTVFNLYAFEGYDHKEIAEILNTTEANSKSQYSRAKQHIKRIITEKQNSIH